MPSCDAIAIRRAILAPCLLAAGTLAAGETVVEVRTLGTVAIDSGATTPLPPPAKDLLLLWSAEDGRRIAAGEVVFRFDPTPLRRQLDDRRRAARIARLEHERRTAERRAELDTLESERLRLRADLARTQAAIAGAGQRAAERLPLLRGELAAAQLAAEIAEREAVRQRTERDHGRISAAQAEAAERAAEMARQAVAGPALALRLAEAPPREPDELADLRLRARELAVKLGLRDDGTEDPALGIGARISMARTQIEADLAARRSEVERAEAELREGERDERDRTPLAWVRIAGTDPGGVQRQFRFLPPGRAQPGWESDHGAPFDGRQGWDRQLAADELLWREAAAPTAAPIAAAPGAPRRQGARRRATGTAAPFSGGLALVARPARWSFAVPNGAYSITIGTGDDRSWDGAVLRVEDVPVLQPGRLEAGLRQSPSVQVMVRDGRLDLDLGDGEEKALRAPVDGILVLRPDTRPGQRIDDAAEPLAVLAADAAIMVDALVPQELAPLLDPQRHPAVEGPLAARIALAGVELHRRDGAAIPAGIATVGAQNVRFLRGERQWSGGNPADNTAREVRLRPEASAGAALVQGETVEVVLRFALPPGSTALPPHLVRIDRDGAAIAPRAGGAELPVEAVRLGRAIAVSTETSPAGLLPPPPRRTGPVADAQGRFRGEVVPGDRTRVAIQWIWGRVESLVPDGSQVEAGQVVLSVYNPQIEADQERQERERRAAVQRVLAAAEQRRQGLARAQGEHAARVVAEAAARERLRRLSADDPAGAETQRRRLAQADADQTAAATALARQRALTLPDASDLAAAEVAVRRGALAASRARLDAAAWELSLDWSGALRATGEWQDRVADLARRDSELAEAAAQERINTLSDRIDMERAVEGNRWLRHFERWRQVKAPVSGRILFQTGWNDQTQRSEKIGPEFPVWSGMTVAEVVDERELRFSVELPEDRFPGLAAGAACEIEFEAAPGRSVPARLIEFGRAFVIPRDRLQADDAAETVTSRRAFTALAAFSPTDELRRLIATGAKGWVRIP